MVHFISKNTKSTFIKKISMNLNLLEETTNFIIGEKGEEIIGDYTPNQSTSDTKNQEVESTSEGGFTDVNFDDI